MPDEFLSICIPTRNRSHLLRDLLVSLAAELQRGDLTPEDVRILVSDNASTDATKVVAHEVLGSFPHFSYSCNPTNIGGNQNILLCASKGRGSYRWIIGDDEILTTGTLPYLLSVLREKDPGWFIHSEGTCTAKLKPPRLFASVHDFVRSACTNDPPALILAGGISFCTFRVDCYDHALAKAQLEQASSYPQFFALLEGLRRTGAPVFATERRTILVREQRPAPVDGELPLDSDRNWRRCMEWVNETFQVTLDPDVLSRHASQGWLRQMFRNPWRTFRNNGALFLIPGTYPRIVKRLWYAIKH